MSNISKVHKYVNAQWSILGNFGWNDCTYICFVRISALVHKRWRGQTLAQALSVHIRMCSLMCLAHFHNICSFVTTRSDSPFQPMEYSLPHETSVKGAPVWGLTVLAVSSQWCSLPLSPWLGLQIIYSLDEVAFIQNLVFYIETAYRIPVSGLDVSIYCVVTVHV